MQHKKFWNNCLKVIKDNLDKSVYETWFEPIQASKFENNVLQLQVPSMFFYEYIEAHYIHLLKNTIKKEIGNNVRLEYNILVDKNEESRTPYTVNIPTQNKLYSQNNETGINITKNKILNPFKTPDLNNIEIDPNLNSHYTFDNYVEGKSNKIVVTITKI